MRHVHVHLHVADLAASTAFYRRFLGAEPVKEKPGYAKFLPAAAPLNLALSSGNATGQATISHLGLQLDTVEAVHEALSRAKASGLSVREEMGVECCYANQDKFWVRDPDGVEWEVYHLNFDVDEMESGAATADAACCAPAPVRIGLRR